MVEANELSCCLFFSHQHNHFVVSRVTHFHVSSSKLFCFLVNNQFSEDDNGRKKRLIYQILCHYIIGTHSNNVLIWLTKRILGTVFLCPYSVCPK